MAQTVSVPSHPSATRGAPAASRRTEADAATRFHRVRSLQVEGGFLDGIALDFAEDLNCVIGGRGTGKTTILEILRWVLDQPSTQGRSKDVEKLIKSNLGTGVARAKIETAEGVVYLVERSPGEDPRVFDQQGEPAPFSLRNGAVFAADAYGQNEIEQIADEPRFQLRLLDKFIEPEVRAIEAEIAGITSRLALNAGEVDRARREASELRDQLVELADVNEKLKAFAVSGSTPSAPELQREQALEVQRRQESDALKQIEQLLSDKGARIESVRRDLGTAFAGTFDQEMLSGLNGELLQGLRDSLRAQLAEFGRKLDEAGQIVRACRGEVTSAVTDLKRRHDAQERRYREVLAQHEQERGRARERTALVKRQADLLDKQKRLRAKDTEAVEKEKCRRELMAELSRLRDQRFQKRNAIAEWLTEKLGPMIRVRVDQFGDASEYEALLADALKGSGLRYGAVVEKIVEQLSPPELASIVARNDRKALEDELGLDGDRAARLILQLRESSLLHRIEVAEMADRPVIELRDGGDYKDSSSLSTGQKCTTILPILLLRNERPLLIDQPEDNLDNAFIYETVVRSILRLEGRRQLILVTHNPNIPVLGGAGRVFVLESTGRRARVKVSGDVDKVKGDIETLLEGGSEAFKLRKQRYGY